MGAAIALVALVPEFTGLSRFEFLRAFFALIAAWRRIAAALGDVLGQLPFIPDLEPETVNALLFTASVGLPSAYYMWQSRWVEKLIGNPGRSLGAPFTILLYFWLYEDTARKRIDWFDLFEANLLSVAAPGFLATAFVVAALKLRGYGRGIVYVASFIGALQVLYWLNAPWLVDWINSHAVQTVALF